LIAFVYMLCSYMA